MANEDPEPLLPRIDAGTIYHVLFRHKWVILLCWLTGLLAAAAVFVWTPVVYVSDAKLLVRYVMEHTGIDPEAKEGEIISPTRSGENIINSEIEILLSRDLIEGVVDDIGADRFAHAANTGARRLEAVVAVARRLRVDIPKKSNVIAVRFEARDPALAKDVLGRVVDRYLRKHDETHRAAGTYEFLARQTDEVRSRLVETEAELRRIKSGAGIVSTSEAQDASVARIKTLQQSIEDARASLAAAQARLASLRQRLAAAATNLAAAASTASNAAVARAPAVTRLDDDLRVLRRREQDLMTTYTADSAPVKAIRRQIDELEKQGPAAAVAAGDPGAGRDSVTLGEWRLALDDEAEVAAMAAKIRVMEGYYEQAQREAKAIDAIAGQIAEQERRRELLTANYKYFAERLEQARAEEAIDARKLANISIVQPATYPAVSVRPKLWRNVLIALCGGFFGGLALAFYREHVADRTLRNPAQVETALQAPVLLTMPRVAGRPRQRLAPGRMPLLAAHNAGQAEPAPAIDPALRPHFDALCDRLAILMEGAGRKPYVLGIAACSRASGGVAVAEGVAVTLACGGDHRVMLVDANMEHAAAHRLFGVDPVGGLTALTPEANGGTAVVHSRFHVLPPQGGTPPPETVMSPSQRLVTLIQRLRETPCACVLVDLPPISDTSLTLAAARFLDGLVLTIPSERVSMEVATHAQRLLARSRANVVGTLLTDRRDYVPAWLHRPT